MQKEITSSPAAFLLPAGAARSGPRADLSQHIDLALFIRATHQQFLFIDQFHGEMIDIRTMLMNITGHIPRLRASSDCALTS